MQRLNFHSLLNSDSTKEPRQAIAVTGSELQELISPTLYEEFANHYFSRLPFGVRGTAEKFKHIFGWEVLSQALTTARKITDKRFEIKACFSRGEASGSARRMIPAYPDQLAELLQAGATVCVTNIHLVDPFLDRWSSAIRDQLNFTGSTGVNCYLSADGSGFATHYDARVATTLQIHGKKRWRYSTQPAKPWPARNAKYHQTDSQANETNQDHIGKLPPDMEFQEVELGPGDLLCLPAGTWHSACAIGHSLALNIYFEPRNFLYHLIPVIQALAVSNSNWVSGPPATLEKVHGSMPKPVSTYMQERLDEFRDMLMEVMDSPCMLTEPWLKSLTDNPASAEAGPSGVSASTPLLAAQQRLRVTALLFRFVQCQNDVLVSCENGLFRFPLPMTPILHRLFSESQDFTADDVLRWRTQPGQPPADEVMSCLQTLLKSGILESASQTTVSRTG